MLSKIAFALISLFFVGATCTSDPFVNEGSIIIKNKSNNTEVASMLVFDKTSHCSVGDCPINYTIEPGMNQTFPIKDVTQFESYVAFTSCKKASSKKFGPLPISTFWDILDGHKEVFHTCNSHITPIRSPWFPVQTPGDVLTIMDDAICPSPIPHVTKKRFGF
jgi:hypothetical protein